MKKTYSTKHYCPQCFDNGSGELKKLFLDEDTYTLQCDIHGYIQEKSGSASDYETISFGDNPMTPIEPPQTTLPPQEPEVETPEKTEENILSPETSSEEEINTKLFRKTSKTRK